MSHSNDRALCGWALWPPRMLSTRSPWTSLARALSDELQHESPVWHVPHERSRLPRFHRTAHLDQPKRQTLRVGSLVELDRLPPRVSAYHLLGHFPSKDLSARNAEQLSIHRQPKQPVRTALNLQAPVPICSLAPRHATHHTTGRANETARSSLETVLLQSRLNVFVIWTSTSGSPACALPTLYHL